MPWNVWNLHTKQWALLRSVRSERQATEAMEEVFKRQHPEEEFEVRRVFPVLEQHGTRLMVLKPSYIWRLAMEDIERVSYNKTHWPGRIYNFHRKHVLKANTANDIIRAAIADQKSGLESPKEVTRLIYADLELLKAALA
jgi:hypothetical protein